MTNIITLAIAILACISGLWKYFSRKAKYRRELADKAKKDLEDAKKNDDPSSFLDAFGRLR